MPIRGIWKGFFCFSVQQYACSARYTKNTHFWAFKHTHTKYPKAPLLACLVQQYAHLARDTVIRHFLALRIKNTSILGISGFWLFVFFGTEVCAFCAPHPKLTFFWYCTFQTNPHTKYPKPSLLACLVQRYVYFGVVHCKHTPFAVSHFKHANKKTKTLLIAVLVQKYVRSVWHRRHTCLALRIWHFKQSHTKTPPPPKKKTGGLIYG